MPSAKADAPSWPIETATTKPVFGAVPDSTAQKIDAALGHLELEAAQRLAEESRTFAAPLPAIVTGLPAAGIRF